MTTTFQPCREPVRTTLIRTVIIALVIALFISRFRLARLAIAFLIALWPSLGGHFVELFFLNFLRFHISPSRPIQIIARLATWFVGGALIALAMQLTAAALTSIQPTRAPTLLAGAVGFILLELIVHGVLQILGLRNFYNGRN
jgi:hypothetical protein